MASIESNHTCHFMLEQNAKGYFTGNFVCSYCGLKVSQSECFDTLAVTAGHEPLRGLSRTPPRQAH